MKNYQFINHTADLGIKVKGKNLRELFSNAGYAMFDIITEIKRIKLRQTLSIKISQGEIEDIFVDYLRELLSKFDIDKWVFKKFEINKIDNSGLEAVVTGEKINLSKHLLKREIKAVTYHALEIRKNNNLWEAQIIFDI